MPSGESNLERFLAQLASRPDDAGLRAVFADWLLEQGDSRGEAMVLERRGERRKLAGLRKKHAREWLNELASACELDACEFEGGFPTHVTLKPGLDGEVLALLPLSVKSLAADFRTLKEGAPLEAKLDALEVMISYLPYDDFRKLSADLDRIAEISAPTLYFSFGGFLQPEGVDFIAQAFLRSGLADRRAVILRVRDGTLDAACHWLWWAPLWGGGQAWGAQWGGADVQLLRDDDDRFRHVRVDLTEAHKKPLAARIASAATMVAQLARLTPTRVDVRVPDEVRVSKKMIETLNAPRRLVRSIEKIRVTRKR